MKKIMTLLMSLLLAFIVSGCSKKEDSKTIKIGFMPSLVAVPYIYAIEEGLYKEAGIEVEYIPFLKASDRDAALQAGELNAVSTDLVMVLLNNENNIDVQFTVVTEEVFRLVSSPYYEETIVENTSNATVAISEMSVVEYLVERIELTKDVNFNLVGIPAVPLRYAALISDPSSDGIKADLAILPEPFPTQVIFDGGNEIWSNLDDAHYATVLGFKKDFIEKYPDVVRIFHEVTNNAIEILSNKDLDDYKHLIIDKGILQEEYLDESKDKLVPMYPYNSLYAPNEDLFNEVLTWMKEKNYVSNDYLYQDLFFDALN